MKVRFLIALFFVVLFVSGQVKAQIEPVDLSLSTMVLFAMDRNPDVLMAVERQDQIGYFVNEGKSDYYPQVQLEVSGGREYISPLAGSNANNLAKSTVSLNQKLFDGYVTDSEVSRREELKVSADYDVNKEKENLILKVTEYYLSVLRFQNVVKSTENFVVEVDKIVKVIKDMYDAGATGKAMLDYAQSRQAAAYVDLNEAKSSLNDGISNLEFLTGPLPDFVAIVPDEFNPDNIDKSIFVDSMEAENTLIQKNQAELRAMQYQLKSEKGQFYPKVDLRMKAEQKYNDGGDVGAGQNLKGTVNLTYEIFDGFNKKNRVGRVNGQIRELELKDRKIYEELKKDITLAYNQVSALKESIQVTNSEIRSNRALQSLNRENFKLGSINVIELIEGEERLNSAYNRKYKLEQDMLQSTYSLLVTTAILQDKFFCETCDVLAQTTE